MIDEYKNLILKTRQLLPDSEIVGSEILPRYYENMSQFRSYESKRRRFNSMLQELCTEKGMGYVRHSNISHSHLYDGIHLNRRFGTSQYVKNIKVVVNPLVGVINDPATNNYQRKQRSTEQGWKRKADDFRLDEESSFGQFGSFPHQHRRNQRQPWAGRSPNRHQDWNSLREPNKIPNNVNMRLLRLALGLDDDQCI